MVSISVCMIVKNEEEDLPSCLDSLRRIADEYVIVDTGSTDRTKEIAESFGAKVYDFTWVDDFAAARNFAFSKATCDYIYSADADETLDRDNIARFLSLKQHMDPAIDMVQMYYCNQLAFDTVYNYDRELRPKLFKRVRSFVWEDRIHEQVRIEPLILDSEIEIRHHPKTSHAGRDLALFRMMTERDEWLSKRMVSLYARELFKAGTEEDLEAALPFFIGVTQDVTRSMDEILDACCVIARCARGKKDLPLFFKFAMKGALVQDGASEICYELGEYYYEAGDLDEAAVWYFNAAYEAAPVLDLQTGNVLPLQRLSAVYRALGNPQQAAVYQREAKEREEKGPHAVR